MKSTCLRLVDMMVHDRGGALITVTPPAETPENELEISSLDGDKFYKVLLEICPNVRLGDFQEMLRAFAAHTDSDRWEDELVKDLIKKLSRNLTQDQKHKLQALVAMPKDGAMCLNHKGDVIAATVQLRSRGSYQLIKHNGTTAGTRHSGAVQTAEWMGRQGIKGIVFVRSDGGGMHMILEVGLHKAEK